MGILSTHLPLWACVAAFMCGMATGWMLRGVYSRSNIGRQIGMERVIQVTVFVIWAIATTRAAVYGSEYPPLFLNVMFGAIVGSMNKGLGDWILTFIRELTGRK